MFWNAAASAQASNENAEVVAARRARDHASVEELRTIIAKAERESRETNSVDAYLRLGQEGSYAYIERRWLILASSPSCTGGSGDECWFA
ncbi:MAG TPA: hypothetical protein VK619_08220 [Pyrinomonadaceae bacterium]|nr:hypothetical protein [Pyrinomonadaceae bacterium]